MIILKIFDDILFSRLKSNFVGADPNEEIVKNSLISSKVCNNLGDFRDILFLSLLFYETTNT